MSLVHAFVEELASDPEALAELRRLVSSRSQSPGSMTLLTPADVAARCRVTPRTVNRWAAEGRLDAVKVGQGWRFTEQALADIQRPSERTSAEPLPAPRPRQRAQARARSSVADAIRGG